MTRPCRAAKPQDSVSLTLEERGSYNPGAGWSSPVARWAHNPKVAGSNPAPATKSFNNLRRSGRSDKPHCPPIRTALFHEQLQCPRLRLSPASLSRTPILQLGCLPGVWFPSSPVHKHSSDIHRRLDRGMAHPFVLYLHRSARLIEPGAVGVAERVPPDLPPPFQQVLQRV